MAAHTAKNFLSLASAEERGNFDYCEVCRRSHMKGNKHLYSKTHREKIKYILSRFGEKVKSAKDDIAAPCIFPASQESDGSYWCYMCKMEVNKHISDGQITVRHAGFIEHLKSADHLVNTDKFWRDYRLERELKLQYVLTQDDYASFQPALEKALDRYEEEQQKDIAQRADKIRQAEADRQRLFLHPAEVTQDTSDEVCCYDTTKVDIALYPESVSRLTAAEIPCNHGNGEKGQDQPGCSTWNFGPNQASSNTGSIQNPATNPSPRQHGSQSNRSRVPMSRKATSNVLDSGGLTSIGVQALRPGEGNIHTGATPPWLIEDEDEDNSQMLGPSLEDFSKHLERQRKSKLNPNRVGANFDHGTSTREEWLPSFGRVWNHGRRWQSRHQYRKETGQPNSKRKRLDEKEKPAETVSKPP